ncbi:glycine betaine/L-proline ABC transporter substrate-binding protein ProX [Xenorhabdus sp. SF857]|uniref:glycine betaine/L-proline ABC transporter substrate-binding protein ProX n=1 Tax=Xenorhabdus bakwenae TaxID=3026967 RepID=UPI0025582B74|nr:glycine betaine/L-proline ABC transporter substrate-binding protein ProX [Xenorhabdus sp. SF857]WFQ81454.1 glycine betaine/L-proline ABC transporter substrate-binding protein ProX [Xenorhabdus sp. SF857]
MNKRIILGTFLIAFMGLSLSSAASATELPGKGISVQPLQSTISEETFQTLIVCSALEKLGYDVKPIKEVDYNVAYTSIAAGDATFMAVSWVPLHDVPYKAAGGDNIFYRKGNYVVNAAQGYLIDKKTAEKYHITNIAQLKDPKLAKLFDTNGDGKADLTGCKPGWGCESAINHHLTAYGLENTVKQNQGNYAVMMADTIARYRAGKPILYYTWTPYWVSDVLKPGKDVIWLQVPFSATGEGEPLNTQLPNGRNYGFPPSSMRIVANKAWAEKNPAAAKLFAVMTLPITDISAQNRLMHSAKISEADIKRQAEDWIKSHQKTVDSWLKTARKAANKA